MLNVECLSPGDRVRIVDKWCEGCRQNGRGKMDHWLGKVMTVSSTFPSYDYPEDGWVTMVDDDGEFNGNGWMWFAPALDCVVEECDPIDPPKSESELSAFLLRK